MLFFDMYPGSGHSSNPPPKMPVVLPPLCVISRWGAEVNFTLLVPGNVCAPEPLGIQSILIAGGKITSIGTLDPDKREKVGLDCEVIDVAGCIILPGFIDPHAHLVGAGGESGFACRLPEIPLEQIVGAGITTVVELSGTDTVTRDPRCLFAKAHQLSASRVIKTRLL